MIIHNPTNQRFETTIDGVTAYLSYKSIDETTLDYNHTIVPAELGGKGLGSLLAKTALDYAKENGKKIIPSCSFVAKYLEKNPQYQELVVS